VVEALASVIFFVVVAVLFVAVLLKEERKHCWQIKMNTPNTQEENSTKDIAFHVYPCSLLLSPKSQIKSTKLTLLSEF